jgi:hypothetical protein
MPDFGLTVASETRSLPPHCLEGDTKIIERQGKKRRRIAGVSDNVGHQASIFLI